MLYYTCAKIYLVHVIALIHYLGKHTLYQDVTKLLEQIELNVGSRQRRPLYRLIIREIAKSFVCV